MKKIALIIFALLILAAIIAAIRSGLRRTGQTDYVRIKVERGNLKVTVATTGTVQPQSRVEIKPPIAGRIEEVLIDEGVKVRKGLVLALMSSTDRAVLLDAARAKGKRELVYWKEMYKPMPIVAPIDGDLIARYIEPGQTVAANEKLFVISDRLIIQAQIDETDIGRVKRGQAAELTLDAYPTNIITGIVDKIAYEALIVNNVTMYMVDILPEHVPAFMRSGMTANIMVITALTNNVLTLPTSAVHTEGKDTFVWQVNPAGGKKIIRVKISTGMNDGRKIEIVSGLNENDHALVARVRMPKSKQAAVNPFSPFRRKK